METSRLCSEGDCVGTEVVQGSPGAVLALPWQHKPLGISSGDESAVESLSFGRTWVVCLVVQPADSST